MSKMRHGTPDAAPVEAVSRTDFQRLLNRMLDRPGQPPTEGELRDMLSYQVKLNAVLFQSLRVFFERGGVVNSPADASLALALYAADPAKFTFTPCASCVTPDRCGCPARREWLEACRFKATMRGDG